MSNLARVDEFHSNELIDFPQPEYTQLTTYYDEKYKIGWCLMKGEPRPCFTTELLNNLNTYHQKIKTEMEASLQTKYDYIVSTSKVDNVFNLGGDLDLFNKLIKEKDRDQLLSYAINCITPIYQYMIHLDCELTTITLVQGDALGGGFEAALSANILIAERGTKLGLPEILFNLFPGMGAFSLLSRKVGATIAEKIILSGKLYSAEELYEMGVVDILAEKDDGESALYKYIKKANRSANSYQAIRKVKDICNPVTYKELIDIAHIWVDAALKLRSKDLRMIERLVARQSARFVLE